MPAPAPVQSRPASAAEPSEAAPAPTASEADAISELRDTTPPTRTNPELPPLIESHEDDDERTSQIVVSPHLLQSMRKEAPAPEAAEISASGVSGEAASEGEASAESAVDEGVDATQTIAIPEDTTVGKRPAALMPPRTLTAVRVLIFGVGASSRIEVDRGQHADGATRAFLVPVDPDEDIAALLG